MGLALVVGERGVERRGVVADAAAHVDQEHQLVAGLNVELQIERHAHRALGTTASPWRARPACR